MEIVQLNFRFTCQEIDQCIEDVKKIIETNVEWIFDKYNIKDYEGTDCKEISESIFGDIEDKFEDLRKLNEDMRESAEKQLTELQRKLTLVKSSAEILHTVRYLQ